MKIKFEENLEYQLEAIKSITDMFSGQEISKTVFTVEKANNPQLSIISDENDLGTGNKLLLHPEEILENLNKIQTRNGLPKTKVSSKNEYNFSVEMETGTGKTYVYLRTIMELNKKYGLKKFVIVVPSLAIKEGVYKTLQITEEHFKSLYENTPYDYFIYDSKKINMIRNFAVNDSIQILIINIDSFNKDINIINRERDQANGYKPIDYISKCNPIVIVDEPQNMESDIAKNAIKELNPLCTLRYSATHKEIYNPVYKLDSISAYEKKLVKQIEVATVGVTQNLNTEYIKVISIKANKNGITAKIELDIKNKSGVSRKEIGIKHGDVLSEKAKRDIYDGYIVNEITYNEVDPSKSFIDFGKVKLTLGQVNGGQDPILIKRLQIRKTIQEHFEKQLVLKSKGIKVLSLFFIDKVSNYRIYDSETGEAKKGKYALIFEEEYNSLIQSGKYQGVGDVSKVHDGYFSIDKKKTKSGIEYSEFKDTKGNTNADNDTFTKIMKDKEKLLSFNEPLAFIFSHSALKEGWDNPNVFQICTLNETTSEMKKIQEIGRGLRIAVNQDGERVRGFDVNTLTVMANESYEHFVESLQKEMEKEKNIKFGVIENSIFVNIVIDYENEEEIFLGYEKSKEIFQDLIKRDYIDEVGNAKDKLKKDLDEGSLELSEEFKGIKESIIKKLKSTIGKLVVKNANERKKITLNKKVFLSDEFKELWDKVKYKTMYQVNFEVEKLIDKCIMNLDEGVYIPLEKFLYDKKRLAITKGGIEEQKSDEIEENIEVYRKYKLPDIITYLQNETNLTRKSIVKILTKSKTLNSFKKNPQLYLEQASNIIKRTMKLFIVDGIKYEKIGDVEYYSQELFEQNEIFGYLKDEMSKKGNIVETDKTPYSSIVVDSEIERKFAEGLEKNRNIKVYTKLPDWFKIPTPLGNYNPDWAILVEDLNQNKEKLYFIVETKGTISEEGRRDLENLKINCGKKHFEALKVDYTDCDSIDNFKIYIEKLKEHNKNI
ncbi:type III restriction-modification system endonuclease [Pseudostreptobacillus hongkongensis]|uniref:type III restriction-modification system endonuclease n=1 Tax=Pseudostreptobacillus hongkongensis TaxID=1162717 RepID=UPI00082E36E8|nr:DEAD/DEAH box helicase family protein [Pseudostreptobacillus hongkongensis]